ncbi:hypothetical protein Cabys_2762 [Caldithrix abyssi DSM 13497]|uniref:Uncharacterized protein n=1 Tax=Caldithrix abyssi DSM 13497 TaxID=880073 RepID=A0A1J1CAF4_CALAY|nr:hypothetical protein Cabys_2762 [Caldithrix abyssi DSM 13497]
MSKMKKNHIIAPSCRQPLKKLLNCKNVDLIAPPQKKRQTHSLKTNE